MVRKIVSSVFSLAFPSNRNIGKLNFVFLQSNCAVTEISFPIFLALLLEHGCTMLLGFRIEKEQVRNCSNESR